MQKLTAGKDLSPQFYTPNQKLRRDNSVWTKVQAILAPIQFLVCFISIGFVINYLYTGEGYIVATSSILLKTALLYLIMTTGAIWEKEVFGQYLLAPAFFWEDVVSFFVIALHTAYVLCLIINIISAEKLMWLALVAYAAYFINALQFLIKFRLGRNNSKEVDQMEKGVAV